ncbi:MAG: DUF4129 domain-containing protein [Acidobacteriota bacterium]|nr:DUF4129 domain-containing protein [Acidobacteriota bacterium]
MRILLFASLFIGMSASAQTTLPLDRYVSALERVHTLIAANQIDAAKSEAATLTGAEIVSSRGDFHADESLLAAIAQARGADPALLARIELTVAELRGAAQGKEGTPDPKLLRQVAAEQDVPELARGGELTAPSVAEVPLMERVLQSIGESFRWIGRKVVQFIDWVRDFFPRRAGGRSGTTAGMRWIVIAVVALIVIVIVLLAVEVTRRARRGNAQTLTSSAPMRSTRDDDPLSRGATEWERFALQLAAAGRFREAIRAWYHAVLVTSYAAGVLHFRKGRTNWEYIASLSAATAWRPELIRLTQRFEQEWYGSDQSSEDALETCSASAKRILDALQQIERGAA